MDRPSMETVMLSAAQAGYTSAILDAVEVVKKQLGVSVLTIEIATELQKLVKNAGERVKHGYDRAGEVSN